MKDFFRVFNLIYFTAIKPSFIFIFVGLLASMPFALVISGVTNCPSWVSSGHTPISAFSIIFAITYFFAACFSHVSTTALEYQKTEEFGYSWWQELRNIQILVLIGISMFLFYNGMDKKGIGEEGAWFSLKEFYTSVYHGMKNYQNFTWMSTWNEIKRIFDTFLYSMFPLHLSALSCQVLLSGIDIDSISDPRIPLKMDRMDNDNSDPENVMPSPTEKSKE